MEKFNIQDYTIESLSKMDQGELYIFKEKAHKAYFELQQGKHSLIKMMPDFAEKLINIISELHILEHLVKYASEKLSNNSRRNLYEVSRQGKAMWDEVCSLTIRAESTEEALEIASKQWWGDWEFCREELEVIEIDMEESGVVAQKDMFT